MLNNSIRGGPDAPANERVREVEYVVRRLRDHETDIAHVFVCHSNERDSFVANDVTELIKRGRQRSA